MATVTQDKYSPYPRVCDICGKFDSIAKMTKLDSVTWVCEKHTGERTRIMLDVLNAHARPPQTWPVKNPKPQDPQYPNTLDYDEGAAFSLIDRQIQAQCRYELVESGSGPATSLHDAVPAMAWSARYLYGLIQQGTRLLLIARAKVLLTSCASYLLSRQYGSSTGPSPSSTQATDAFYGGVLESGASVFQTDDVAAAGLALLYAYRILGTKAYLIGARSAASYLRNVQAIGSSGTHYTSQDSAGSARLYTGSLASQVSTASGFYSNSLFYPSALIALELWKELTTTDGDQSIGATTTVAGFTITPSRLMSLSITDLRACWTNGIRDATTTVINGLSSTTPREVFNAYPVTKPNFPVTFGSGMWEFADGTASTGTQISAQNFARALSSLYAYEGASSQVTTVLAWLRSFASNSAFETPVNTSVSVLARTTTGVYDPTVCLSTLLTVRDSTASYAAIAKNGSSLYDWGAFGAMSSLLAGTDMTSFKNSRLGALNLRQRYDDGTPNDAILDRIELRGLSGLSYQTAFASNTNGNPTAYTAGTRGVTAPPKTGLVFWIKGDAGFHTSGGILTKWDDQSGFAQDMNYTDPGFEPLTGLDTINGIPCASFPDNGGLYILRHDAIRDRNGVRIGYGPGETQARTIMAVLLPKTGAFSITGGPVLLMGGSNLPAFIALFDLESTTFPNAFYLWGEFWRDLVTSTRGADTPGSTYNNVPVVGEWRSNGFPNLSIGINGVGQTITPATMPGSIGAASTPITILCNILGLGLGLNFQSAISEMLIWDYDIATAPDQRNQAIAYLASRYSSTGLVATNIAMTNDAVRAAQFAMNFRQPR